MQLLHVSRQGRNSPERYAPARRSLEKGNHALIREFATLLRRTDYRRWSDLANFDASWEPRTRRAAELVPKSSHVIEFGAGSRNLERYLDPSCTYVPSDIVDRGPDTLVCDLNERPLPDLGAGTYDVAVILGVLEYLRDVPSVLDWLAKQVDVCVVSYVCLEPKRHSLRGVRDSRLRLKAGWMNNYREGEIRSLFQERGYEQLSVETCTGNRLFLFSQRR